MHSATRPLAVRSYLAAGVAIVGASAIAVSPMAPPMPNVHLPAVHLPSLHSTDVKLASLTDVLAAYQDVFNTANANVQELLGIAAKNPTPILSQVLTNQLTGFQEILNSLPTGADALATALTGAAAADPSSSLSQVLASDPSALQTLVAALQTAFAQVNTALTTTVPPLLQGAFSDLTQANVEGAVNNVILAALAPLFPLTGVIGPALGVVAAPLQSIVTAIDGLGPVATVLANPLQNVVNVLNIPSDPSAGLFFTLAAAGLIGPVFETPAAIATGAQGVIDAIKTGDPASVLGAAATAPATIAGGILNGGLGPNIGDLVAPLIGIPPGLVTVHLGGLLNGLLDPGPNGSINSSGLLAGLQEIQTLVAGAIKPPVIQAAAKESTITVAADTTAPAVTAAKTVTDSTAKPSALPSLKSIGLKLPHLPLKPATASDATTTTATADTATKSDATTKSDDSGSPAPSSSDKDGANKSDSGTKSDSGAKSDSGKSYGRHARHDSSSGGSSSGGEGGSGSQGASSGGRHRAA